MRGSEWTPRSRESPFATIFDDRGCFRSSRRCPRDRSLPSKSVSAIAVPRTGRGLPIVTHSQRRGNARHLPFRVKNLSLYAQVAAKPSFRYTCRSPTPATRVGTWSDSPDDVPTAPNLLFLTGDDGRAWDGLRLASSDVVFGTDSDFVVPQRAAAFRNLANRTERSNETPPARLTGQRSTVRQDDTYGPYEE